MSHDPVCPPGAADWCPERDPGQPHDFDADTCTYCDVAESDCLMAA
jgi:hypothetical protein